MLQAVVPGSFVAAHYQQQQQPVSVGLQPVIVGGQPVIIVVGAPALQTAQLLPFAGSTTGVSYRHAADGTIHCSSSALPAMGPTWHQQQLMQQELLQQPQQLNGWQQQQQQKQQLHSMFFGTTGEAGAFATPGTAAAAGSAAPPGGEGYHMPACGTMMQPLQCGTMMQPLQWTPQPGGLADNSTAKTHRRHPQHLGQSSGRALIFKPREQ
jgi:hypothetical protein